jgi:DNA-directed RNA polymerase subunit K/omega
MIERPPEIGAFHFVVLATLRAKQLMRGCVPRVSGSHKKTTLAKIEVAGGQISGELDAASAAADPALARR